MGDSQELETGRAGATGEARRSRSQIILHFTRTYWAGRYPGASAASLRGLNDRDILKAVVL